MTSDSGHEGGTGQERTDGGGRATRREGQPAISQAHLGHLPRRRRRLPPRCRPARPACRPRTRQRCRRPRCNPPAWRCAADLRGTRSHQRSGLSGRRQKRERKRREEQGGNNTQTKRKRSVRIRREDSVSVNEFIIHLQEEKKE